MNNFNKTLNTPLKTLFPGLGKILHISKNTAEILFSVFVFILIPLIAFTLITSRTPALGGFQSFTVLSGSMSPVIPTGSIVYTQIEENFNKGDIITFKRNGVNVTHRIVDITNKSGQSVTGLVSPLPSSPYPAEIFYKTKGDANESADTELVSKADIVGKTFIQVPFVGVFANFLKTMPGFLGFIILPTLIFISFELWNIKKEIEKQTERKVLERMRVV